VLRSNTPRKVAAEHSSALQEQEDLGEPGARLRLLPDGVEGRFAQSVPLEQHEFEANVVGVESECWHGGLGPAGVAHTLLALFAADAPGVQMVQQRKFVVMEKVQGHGRVRIRRSFEYRADQTRLESTEELDGPRRRFETRAQCRSARLGAEQCLARTQGLVDFVIARKQSDVRDAEPGAGLAARQPVVTIALVLEDARGLVCNGLADVVRGATLERSASHDQKRS